MCTQRYIVFTHCACTPIRILKCPAQEFVESQARTKNRKKPLIYKYCVNFMAAREVWGGCCRGKREGVCSADGGGEGKIEGMEVGDVEESENFGPLKQLPSTMNGRIGGRHENIN
jgi:hypothetical protein